MAKAEKRESLTPLVLTASVRLNEKEQPFDGGRLVLHMDDKAASKRGFQHAEVILNASTDEALEAFPSTRKEMERRRFRVTIEEVAPAEETDHE